MQTRYASARARLKESRRSGARDTPPNGPATRRAPLRFSAIGLALAAALAPAAAQQVPDPAAAPAAPPPSQQVPLWEIGLAGGVGATPEYPASDRYDLRFLPLPYFIYRGGFFRSDQSGTRLRADLQRNVQLEFSGEAAFAVPSSGSGPRAGMPDLNYLFGFGPSLKLTLERPAPAARVLLDLPVRALISLQSSPFALTYEGIEFAPDLAYETRHIGHSDWTLRSAFGTQWASERTLAYFYEVAPQYATPARPAYDAHGGYLGSWLDAAVSHPLADHLRIYFFLRADYYGGASNENSPLFKAKAALSGFVGFSWSIRQSKRRVDEPG